MNEQLGACSVGSASDYGAQMLSHDFIKGLARELVFDLDGHRVYGVHASCATGPSACAVSWGLR
ncbi:hypothetical protein PENPOL_c006G00915 [Penicillium polonicum]|uniref:Uncharacterized protein n=1 Tax=Penicillium polonicum TaxID=60169 RepID=A0A1V6NLA2_PENPO|nr:hypothetical protein PENPOL_c006G00915 [Penicillium polonicum]